MIVPFPFSVKGKGVTFIPLKIKINMVVGEVKKKHHLFTKEGCLDACWRKEEERKHANASLDQHELTKNQQSLRLHVS